MTDLPACPHCGKSLGFRVDGVNTNVINMYYVQSGEYEESFHHSHTAVLNNAVLCLACKQVRTDLELKDGQIVPYTPATVMCPDFDEETHHE